MKVKHLSLYFLIFGVANAAPTTQPAVDPASYRAGYGDGSTGKPNAYPIPVEIPKVIIPPIILPLPTTKPTTIPTTLPTTLPAGTISDGTDLTDLLEPASGTTTVLNLVANGHYKTTRTINPAGTLTVNGNASTIALNVSPGATAYIMCNGPGTVTFNGTYLTPDKSVAGGVAIRYIGPYLILYHDCLYGFQGNDIWTDDPGAWPYIDKTYFGHTTSVSAYFGSGNWVVKNSYFAGSDIEYSVRMECSTKGVKQSGGLLQSCIIRNTAGAHKDTIGIRLGDNVHLVDNTIEGDVRWGESGATPTTDAGGCVLTGNRFVHTGSWINASIVYGGATLTATNNRFYFLAGAAPAMGVGKNSILTASGNVMVHPASMKIPKLIGVSSKGTIKDDGTTIEDTSLAGNVPPSLDPQDGLLLPPKGIK